MQIHRLAADLHLLSRWEKILKHAAYFAYNPLLWQPCHLGVLDMSSKELGDPTPRSKKLFANL